MERGTSRAHIKSVLAIEDRVVRNYWVTQTYSDLSLALASVLSPGTTNWCTFATWASYTVGNNMRGQELPKWLHSRIVLDDGMMGAIRRSNEEHGRRRLDQMVSALAPDHVLEVARELFGACALNLSNGNTEVFAEIAPVASLFVERYGPGAKAITGARAAVLRACTGALEFEGVNRLRAGFALWCDAMGEKDAARKSQLILAGSLQLGAHEQNHLQGAIAGSMDMGVNQAVASLGQRLLLQRGPSADLEKALTAILRPIGPAFADMWGDLMTELLGAIQLPDGTLRLDQDVPPLKGLPFTPPDLVPVTVKNLSVLLARFDRSSGDGVGSKARDWVSLDDRMNFISNLFVSRLHRASFFEPPFTAQVIESIEAGLIPAQAVSPPTTSASQAGLGVQLGRGAPTVGVDKFTPVFLDAMRSEGDPPADAAVSAFFTKTGEGHAELFRRLTLHEAGCLDDSQLPGVGAFVTELEPWPSWAERELVERGQQVFGDWGPQLGMGLWMASLPADYACARGAEPLVRTARLTDEPKRRYVETGQMIIDAMTPKALEAGAKGYQVVRRVRLMHAAVRHVLLHAAELEADAGRTIEPWHESLGTPLNQEDLLGCLFSFNVVGIHALERSGVVLSDLEKEAYIHSWNLVGHQIGIRDDVLPLDLEDSRALWEIIKKRNYAPSEAGRELTGAAISCINDLVRVPFLRGLPATGIRHYLGDQTADLLGVPGADWTRLFFLFVNVTDWVFEHTIQFLPARRILTAMLGRRMLEGFEVCERGGDRPSFAIPDELKQAWGMSIS